MDIELVKDKMAIVESKFIYGLAFYGSISFLKEINFIKYVASYFGGL